MASLPFQIVDDCSFADNFVYVVTSDNVLTNSRRLSVHSIHDEVLSIPCEDTMKIQSVSSNHTTDISTSHMRELSINCGDDTYTDAILSAIEKEYSHNSNTNSPRVQITQKSIERNNGILLSISSDLECSSSNQCRLSLASAASPNKTNERMCRICLESDDQADIIAPCKCSGSTKYAHEQCLLQWFFKSNNRTCEVCLGKVNVKPMGYKPFQQWRLPERGCDFIVYLFGLYFVIMVIFTGMITWIATQRCASPVCVTLYAVCAVALVYFFYCCGCVEYSRRYWRSLVSVNRVWRIYGREDSHKGIKLTPKISKKHFITPIETSETIRSNVEPFVINISSERRSGNNVSISPQLFIPSRNNQSSGTINPVSVIDDEDSSPAF